MHILTGLYNPTAGTAKINGLDIRESITEIRSQIGFTPQYNVLFTGMTVKEHLWFYSRLKGIDQKTTTRASIQRMITETGLAEFENERVERLSSGLQRKLSVAIAFVGDSKIVILDEPSAGVDPAGRRSIWDVLLRYKKDRTIVMSTHYMDEAEILSDRVVIIAEGKLIAHGTPAYLKKTFGQGYYLTVCKNNSNDEMDCSDSSRDDLINEFVTSRFKTAELIENNCSEITYSIPNRPEFTKFYAGYFKEIETNYGELGISHVKLTDTNLEEVFLKLTEKIKTGEKRQPIPVEEDNEPVKTVFERMMRVWTRSRSSLDLTSKRAISSNENSLSKETMSLYLEFTKLRIKSQPMVVIQQFYALIAKRFHRIKRNVKGLLAETVLPLVFVCLALLFSSLTPDLTKTAVLEIHPWHYAKPNLVFMSYAHPPSGNETDLWAAMLESPGPGTRCVKNNRVFVDSNRLSCVSPSTTLLKQRNGSFEDCDLNSKNCANPKYGDLKQYKMPTQDVLFDLTERNISDWLVHTEFSERFFQKRYGGFEVDLNAEASRDFQYLRVSSEQLLDSLDQVSDILEAGGTRNGRFAEYMSAFGDGTLISKKNVKIWYNQKGFHANIAYLNHMNNMLLRAQLKDTLHWKTSTNNDLNVTSMDPSEHGIVAYSEPMPLVKGIPLSVIKKR
jgi:ATP-binding cassette subfamily A (ABC1) protein 1